MCMSTTKKIISAISREKNSNNSQLRKQGKLPANLFGLQQPSQSILLDRKEFSSHVREEGESRLFYVSLEKKEIPVLIDEIQVHPVTEEIVHATLQKVNLKEKVEATISVELINEPEIKDATIILTRQEVDVEALPADLPENILVDASSLANIGDELHWNNTNLDTSKVKLLLEDEDLSQPLAIVQEIKEEVEDVAPVTEGAETPEGEVASEEQPTEPKAENQ